MMALDLSRCRRAVSFARDVFLFPVFTRGMAAINIFRLTSANIGHGRMLGLPFPLNMTVARHSWESMTTGLTLKNLL